MSESEHDALTRASEVVVSFTPADDRTGAALDAPSYRRYLTRAHDGAVAVGDEWEEFVNCGCGTTRDVTLRVESTDGDYVDAETTFVFEPRE
ncbi:hypothetical protein [Halarchaeum sp. P4]|uniref:hypothetical protein n=1 Tax=Halarchaeum sp. P4 TaxID=3421639 RepID=UPI003EBA75E5